MQVSGDPRRPSEVNKYKPPARGDDVASGVLLLLGTGLGFAGFIFKASVLTVLHTATEEN